MNTGIHQPPGSTALRTPDASVQAWRRETALLLGVGDAVARQFGDTGLIEVEGQPVTLHPLHGEVDGPWVATARVARPSTVKEADWCDALLQANARSMLLTHAAFGLAQEGDAILVMRIPADHDHPRFHSTGLDGLLAMANALREGVSSLASASPSTVATSGSVGAAGPPESERPELDATDDIAELIRDTALKLGASPEQAVEAARSGCMDLFGQRVGMVCDPDDEGLVVSIDLGDAFLDNVERCRIALAASLELILHAGAAVSRTARHCRLIARCPLQGQTAASLAVWLQGLAALVVAMRAQRASDPVAPASITSQH